MTSNSWYKKEAPFLGLTGMGGGAGGIMVAVSYTHLTLPTKA